MNPVLGVAYSAAGHLATALAAVAPESERKLLRTFAGRRGVLDRFATWATAHRDTTRPLVWFHAPSVGEGLQARPVIELFRARNPDYQVVYTFYSPSATRFAEQLPVDYADYLPFDTRSAMRTLVRLLRPRALIFSKLDVWPVLCDEAHGAGVTLGMISGTLSATSGRMGVVSRALTAEAYRQLDAVGVIAREDGRRLREVGVRAEVIREIGDTRYDQVWARAQRSDARVSALLNTLRSERPTLVAGSTWPADEERLFEAWLTVRKQVPAARLIIAPHEPTPEHLAPVTRWAQESELSLATLDRASVATDVVLVDRVGVLGDLYALGQVAFIGGGFHGTGLHSVLEPAAFGVPVLFGPQHKKSRDATVLLEHDAAREVRETRLLAHVAAVWLTDHEAARAAGESARGVVQSGLGAAERSCALVESLL